MCAPDRYSRGFVPPTTFRAAGLLPQPATRLLRVLWLVVSVLLLAGLNLDQAWAYSGPDAQVTVAMAAVPSDHPCGPSDGSHQDHALCSLTTICPLFAPADAEFMHLVADRAMPVVGADLDFTSCDPLSPFHPPKLLLVA